MEATRGGEMTGIYTLTTAERYRALAALYRTWFERTGSDYHFALMQDCETRAMDGENGEG